MSRRQFQRTNANICKSVQNERQGKWFSFHTKLMNLLAPFSYWDGQRVHVNMDEGNGKAKETEETEKKKQQIHRLDAAWLYCESNHVYYWTLIQSWEKEHNIQHTTEAIAAATVHGNHTTNIGKAVIEGDGLELIKAFAKSVKRYEKHTHIMYDIRLIHGALDLFTSILVSPAICLLLLLLLLVVVAVVFVWWWLSSPSPIPFEWGA